LQHASSLLHSSPCPRDNIDMTSLPFEILSTFDTLFAEALAAGEPDRTAMTVATSVDGCPSARVVLLKAHDARGFVFYTHLDGRASGRPQGPRAAGQPACGPAVPLATRA